MSNTVIFQLSKLKFLDYATRAILANVKVMGSLNITFTGELAEQMTGPSFFPIETEVNRITTEATLNIGQYDEDILKVLMDARNTTNAITATTGLIKEQENISGSIVASDSGVFTALTLSSTVANIKSGLYRLVVKEGATEVEVYSLASPDLRRADFEDYATSLVKTVTPADGATADLGIGVNATAASTVSFASAPAGSSTIFRVIAPGAESKTSELGQESLVIPKVKLIALGRTMSDGRWFEIFGHNCIFPGLNLNFAEEFSANEITGKLIFDNDEMSVARITAYKKTA